MTTGGPQRLDALLSKATLVCIVAALVFTPLAFGGVEPWAYSILAVLAYTALAAALVRAATTGAGRSMLVPLLIPASVGLLLVGSQCMEWPADLLAVISPRTVELHRAARVSTGALEASAGFAPSLYPHATRNALIVLSSYVALFVATCGYVQSRRHVSQLGAAMVSGGLAVSLLGILQNLSGTSKLYWWRELTHGGALFGPFVSRNQFATYAGVCLFVGMGLLLARAAGAAGSLSRWREALDRRATRWAHQNFLIAFAVALMGAAVLWSLSRGGILSMLLAFAGVLGALGAANARRRKRLYAAAVVVVILGWLSYLGWEPVMRRLATLDEVARDPRSTWRWTMAADAWRMGADFPVLGVGAGTFVSVYPRYRTLPTRALTVSPHSEYFHVFAETGLTGVVTVLLAMGLLYVTAIRGLAARKNPYVRGFLAGGLGMLLMVTLHSAVDFPMRSPAVAATVAVAAALVCRVAQIEPNSKRKRAVPALGGPAGGAHMADGPAGSGASAAQVSRGARARSRRRRIRHGVLAFGVVAVGWALACDFGLRPLRGELEARLVRRARERIPQGADDALAFLEASERALPGHSGGDAGLYAELADLALAAAAAADPLQALTLEDKSLEFRVTAARLEPANADHSFWIAMYYLRFQRPDLAWPHVRRACELLPHDPWIRAYLADAFRAYGWPALAGGFLEEAERLTEGRAVEAARPLIADIGLRLEEARNAE